MDDRFKFRTPIFSIENEFCGFQYSEIKGNGLKITGYSGIVEINEFLNFGKIEQCTGLKDKNGRLIYEGDIVKDEVEEPELKVMGIITFGRYVYDLGFYVEWRGVPAESRKYYPGWRQDLFYWLEETPLEVIGNIHENPELLEAENGNN